ncbi:MAG: Glycoprotease family exported protein [Candidatus Uhrbacteria bacterium GW2011_GWF2_41_16]|jgi:tRNA A37 threonylcarbamoyladenosine modification protein TsaB|uniref:Glycoprotease family exported protein n=2 Tax=Candidatus Uhriibacteriota TaxID=1752732 RepID=A0A0G0XP68_9BACT|nr:MAG: Glycoprotease family exported protein [Candidatus Uhrbacteria bacterium GW2011_GWA2_41_10]KKR87610.1 MAG: Glycoprotease family exported protein [Candidatus Uhrbacteria bacterium GW2011_GWC2_41_11]KKR98590.1 MAG: Glycoprotease family exported protein [Candidatus Uhrbacteria bacterium GW2011_GWF2_41_16]HBO99789.1 hypothetical protein [Candidatus Uhrbacteria bacterium]
MYLFLSAQDIQQLEVGFLDEQGYTAFFSSVPTPPEMFLFHVDRLMHEWKIEWKTILGVAVVVGPGSFTSTRLSVTMANGIAFARHIPIIGVENIERLSLSVLLSDRDWIPFFHAQKIETFVVPIYDRPPLITLKKIPV